MEYNEIMNNAEFQGKVLEKLGNLEEKMEGACDDVGELKLWRVKVDTRYNFFVGIAAFIGSIITLVLNTGLDLWKRHF
jgi:hypothetical protein